MPYQIADLHFLPVGTRVRGYRFDCENCGEACIGSKATRFCSPACRIEAYRYDEFRAEIAAMNAEIAALNADRSAEDAAIADQDAQHELELLQWLALGSETAAEAAEYVSANIAADEIPEMDDAGLRELARIVWRHGFLIRLHQGPVRSHDDLVPIVF